MDSSIVATALITIGNYFDDFLQIQWVVLAYLLTYLGKSLEHRTCNETDFEQDLP